MAKLSMLVAGCPGHCGRPATTAEIICLSCLLDLPVELAQAVELGRIQMVAAAKTYSAAVLAAADWFDTNRPLVAATAPNPAARHTPAELCDCPPPVPGRPYHCAAARSPREHTT